MTSRGGSPVCGARTQSSHKLHTQCSQRASSLAWKTPGSAPASTPPCTLTPSWTPAPASAPARPALQLRILDPDTTSSPRTPVLPTTRLLPAWTRRWHHLPAGEGFPASSGTCAKRGASPSPSPRRAALLPSLLSGDTCLCGKTQKLPLRCHKDARSARDGSLSR